MDKYRLLYVLVLSCVTTVLPAQLKDYSSQVDSVLYLQPIITQYFIDNKSEIWSLSLIVHSKG